MRAIGLMSGTSLDGIDIADVEVRRASGRVAVRLLHFATTPFGREMRACLEDTLPPRDANVACVAELNFALGEAFAAALVRSAAEWKLDLDAIDVIGSHGQTIYHAPEDGATLQLGEPAVIAARTGVTCVADFRTADVAAGGQGAPLVPFVDRELFGSETEFRAALNIGGIANLTLLPPGCRREDVRAFDTGPGNMVIDACARLASGGVSSLDRDGAMAARGAVHQVLLDELLADPFFARAGPKSTGRERYGAAYAGRIWARAHALGLTPDDVLATVTALTATTIVDALPAACSRVIVSGGGARNASLLGMLRNAGKPAEFVLSDDFGVPVDAKEAIAFAVLACEAIAGRVNQLPSCTGARTGAVLGKIAPGANFERLMNLAWNPTTAAAVRGD